MKKIYFSLRSGKIFLRFILITLLSSLITGNINAQTYVNGNLSTGALTNSGVAAPAGYTWSEVQNVTGNTTVSNTNSGFNGSVFSGFTFADDFTVPAGPSWTISKLTFYAYRTGAVPTPSPFTGLRVQIHSGNPSAGPTTIVFGDLTTNRLSASNDANMYRIFNTIAPPPGTVQGITRKIWTLEASINVTLAPGTYWLEWQTDQTPSAAHFAPPSTVPGVRTVAGYNAQQKTVATGVWAAIVDGGNPVTPPSVACDMPFKIDYSTGGCSGTPAPGNTISTLTTACPGVNVGLSLQNTTIGAGVTYQWQSGPSVTGPWTTIVPATSSTYSTTITATTFFRCMVTCLGNSASSVPVQVLLTPVSGCYCAAGATSLAFEKISRVAYNTINNASTSTAGYEDFTAISTTVVQQSAIPITVTLSGPFASDQVIVWIDFNQNGSFADAGERVYISTTGVGPHTGMITIPATAPLGSTRMRVRMHDTQGPPTTTAPCGNSTYGQVEDYKITIAACVPVNITTQPANASVQCGGTTSFSVAATGSGPAYQWEVKTTPTGFWNIITNTGVYTGATTNTLTITGATTNMNAYQYRAIFSGYCRGTDFTNAATLTVTPYLAPISPVPAVKCTNSNLQIFASPPPTVTTVTSPNLAIPILNGNGGGVLNAINHTLAVSGISAGATITNISIKLNITHTYISDLELVIKAPNGKVLNLSNLIGGQNNPGENFTNTVFSSNATAALSTGVSPGYTGTFKPDAGGPVGAFGVAGGPAGFLPTFATGVGTLNDLASIPNGNWTIAMYDAGPPDVGTLDNWSISITWGVAPATGIFSPTTNLFLDAAATIPYTGTAVNSVYTNTPTTTTYSAIVSNATCTSAATPIPVTVTAPLTTVSVPATTNVCFGGNTSIAATAATGTASVINYTWQVSTDGGATWNTISNTGFYSGATTGTLTISNANNTLQNNKYRAVATIPACGAGSVTSTVSTLTVNAAAVVVINAGPVTQLYPGLTSTLTAAVSPNAGASYQWYRNGVAVTGATASTIVVDVDGFGTYTVTAVDANGCSGTSTNSIDITAAPNDVLFIYPSPNNGQFQVRYQSLDGNTLARSLTIYDSKGSRVYSKIYSITAPYGMMSVDMRNQGKGIYRVELSDANGNRIKTGSVLVL